MGERGGGRERKQGRGEGKGEEMGGGEGEEIGEGCALHTCAIFTVIIVDS